MTQDLIFEILAGAVSLLFGGVMKLFWDRLRRIESEVRDLQSDTQGMKANYIERFEKLSSQIGDFRVDVTGQIGEIKTLIADCRPRSKR
jgi:uncharacterized protein (UPF0335 family)